MPPSHPNRYSFLFVQLPWPSLPTVLPALADVEGDGPAENRTDKPGAIKSLLLNGLLQLKTFKSVSGIMHASSSLDSLF
jgi:hypothetical protein